MRESTTENALANDKLGGCPVSSGRKVPRNREIFEFNFEGLELAARMRDNFDDRIVEQERVEQVVNGDVFVQPLGLRGWRR